MGIREKVKKGLMTVDEALAIVSPTAAIHQWCLRRKAGPKPAVAPATHATETTVGKKARWRLKKSHPSKASSAAS